ncbi:MAG: hypothetical protein HC888_08175 [Candidatus Competibacteraceae bacterium]|nr:hypothetical protein [Candidatus Competibacteraceae bacterium]
MSLLAGGALSTLSAPLLSNLAPGVLAISLDLDQLREALQEEQEDDEEAVVAIREVHRIMGLIHSHRGRGAQCGGSGAAVRRPPPPGVSRSYRRLDGRYSDMPTHPHHCLVLLRAEIKSMLSHFGNMLHAVDACLSGATAQPAMDVSGAHGQGGTSAGDAAAVERCPLYEPLAATSALHYARERPLSCSSSDSDSELDELMAAVGLTDRLPQLPPIPEAGSAYDSAARASGTASAPDVAPDGARAASALAGRSSV